MGNGEKVTCELIGDIDIKYKNKNSTSHMITPRNLNLLVQLHTKTYTHVYTILQYCNIDSANYAVTLSAKTPL